MAANATSRRRQAKREDRALHQVGTGGGDDPQTVGAKADPGRSAPARKQARIDDDATTPQIKAAKQRSAELLRDAMDLVTLRTNAS